LPERGKITQYALLETNKWKKCGDDCFQRAQTKLKCRNADGLKKKEQERIRSPARSGPFRPATRQDSSFSQCSRSWTEGAKTQRKVNSWK